MKTIFFGGRLPGLNTMRFRWHAKKWHEQTRFDSTGLRFENKHYWAIINLGKPIVPLLLKEMSQRPDWWHMALWQITGENPVKQEHLGRLNLSCKDWIEWGREKGII